VTAEAATGGAAATVVAGEAAAGALAGATTGALTASVAAGETAPGAPLSGGGVCPNATTAKRAEQRQRINLVFIFGVCLGMQADPEMDSRICYRSRQRAQRQIGPEAVGPEKLARRN
jgi:hypothetical protein